MSSEYMARPGLFYGAIFCYSASPVVQMVESACSAGDPGWIPGSGRSPGEENGYALQYSCLENPMDRGAWWATVHGIIVSDTTEWLILSFSLSHCY